MAKMTISKGYNTLKIGDTITEDGKSYKVKDIALRVNQTGGTDYIVEETRLSMIKNKLRSK